MRVPHFSRPLREVGPVQKIEPVLLSQSSISGIPSCTFVSFVVHAFPGLSPRWLAGAARL